MTAQILAAELGNLISDSKRKNTELRTAAEKSLQDLKSLSNTSEAQLSAGKHSVVVEDGKALEIPIVTEVKGDDGLVPVRPAANDAYKVFNDLNLLVTGEKPAFVRFSAIPPASILELIEAVLSNYSQVMVDHPEQVHILRNLLMPLIIRSLSDRLSFPIVVRIIRILNLIIRNHLTILPSECEIALGLLNHMLDPQASQLWKRALCLEVFRGIYADSRLLLAIYHQFDAQDGKKKIFGDNLASFVRLATEKPALIGLGQHSTAPVSYTDDNVAGSDQAAAAAGAMAGDIGGPVSDRSSNNRPSGISTQWSSMKTPCTDHLDKSEPPSLPETYIYSLVLTCITNISESLARFVLPLTVYHDNRSRRKTKTDDSAAQEGENTLAEEGGRRLSRTQSFRKKTIPVNPLDLTEHPAYAYIETSLALVTECWPAILATCSTFLNAALDVDYYRALVRAIQKFTQVSGLLRMATPRDAFLTTMGKAAVPSNLLLTSVVSPKTATGDQPGMFNNAKGLLSVDSLVSQSSGPSADQSRRPSHDIQVPSLGPRNLLCLRALLNLAIALGPTLQSAWSIVFETLQVADLVLSLSNQSGSRGSAQHLGAEGSIEKMETETAAVQAAARRLFESTADFPNESFTEVLQALCALLNDTSPTESGQMTPTTADRPQILHMRRLGSVSRLTLNTETNSRDAAFALNKIGELAALNEARLSQYDPTESGWDTFVHELVRFSANERKASASRLLAADILSRTIRDIAEISMYDEQREQIQARILATLQRQISVLRLNDIKTKGEYSDIDVRVHQIALDALKSVIEQCGESLVAGWASVLDSLLSVFLPNEKIRGTEGGDSRKAHTEKHDLNMSLTAITFFWNMSDYLQSRSDIASLPSVIRDAQGSKDIRAIVKSSSEGGDTSALWLQVLLNLATTTTDQRAEVRNSAVQTIQRIFENYTDQLSSEAWMLCLGAILFETIEINLESQKTVRHGSPNTADEIVSWNETTRTILQSGPTFVALSKASMSMLQETTVKHIAHKQIFTDGAFNTALTQLGRPIKQKYAWQKEGKPPTIWQKATTTTLTMLQAGLPQVQAQGLPSDVVNNIWTAIIDISYHITRAAHLDPEKPPASLHKDEAFDVRSFTELRHLITTPLNSASLPDSLRRTYARNLLSISLIHEPLHGELPDFNRPLDDLYKTRLGQTATLPATLRTRMSQTCTSELFNLVAVHDGISYVKLAQAAAPYLILRAALPLKTYIADHPLRGRMPAPDSQRKELLQVLTQLEQLESEPNAIPDAPGVKSKHRKHLHRLYPLIVKATKAARQDSEVFELLVKLTDMVGEEFDEEYE
ncbi:hypothetical protein E8E11_006545 [Didymella keratinophila]|nr:hypothetical protein E8E11_006545 [Didymella keratinophila]